MWVPGYRGKPQEGGTKPPPVKQWGALGRTIHLCPLRFPVCAVAASPLSSRSNFNLSAGCPGSREIYFWLVPGEESPAKVTCQAPSFPPLNCLPALSQTSRFVFFSTRKGCSHLCLQQYRHRATRPLGHRATRILPISKSAGFCSLHKTHRGFCKPVSPCHQTVVSLTEWKKKSNYQLFMT